MPTRKPPTQSTPEKSSLARFLAAITRDLVLFVSGLGLFVFEAVIRQGDPRESLMVIEAGMMGLPAILRFDELRRNGNGGSS